MKDDRAHPAVSLLMIGGFSALLWTLIGLGLLTAIR
jgi:hypothetical protein